MAIADLSDSGYNADAEIDDYGYNNNDNNDVMVTSEDEKDKKIGEDDQDDALGDKIDDALGDKINEHFEMNFTKDQSRKTFESNYTEGDGGTDEVSYDFYT